MIYKLVLVDDLESNLIIFNRIRDQLKKELNYDVEVTHIKKSSDLNILTQNPYDIVFFDYNLEGEFDKSDKNGFNVLQRFREKNTTAKVILFSSEFPDIYSDTFKSSDLNGLDQFTYVDFIRIVNELNIFRITNRDSDKLKEITIEAIRGLDLLLVALEQLKSETNESELDFSIAVRGELHCLDKVINSIKMDDDLGRDFKNEIYKMIMSNIMEHDFNE